VSFALWTVVAETGLTNKAKLKRLKTNAKVKATDIRRFLFLRIFLTTGLYRIFLIMK